MKVKCDKCKEAFLLKGVEKQTKFDDTVFLVLKMECKCGNKISVEVR